MRVLSLFDGISCARVALERAGIPIGKYYSSEVDKYATLIAQKNYPDTIQRGDVRGVTKDMVGGIDLLIGGSPCQDLSIAKANRKGLKGERSGLFWEYVRVLKEVKPKYFVLENVASMPKEAQVEITMTLFNIPPIMIDAALVSAQRRKRLFWVGKRVGDTYEQVRIEQPEDRGIFLRDVLEDVASDSIYQYRRTYWRETKGGKVPTLTANMGTGGNNVPYVPVALRNRGKGKKPEYNGTGKANALTTVQTDSMVDIPPIRKLTCIECERLQSLPDNYTEGVSNTQRYKALGNAFNVEVIAHILKHIPRT